MIGRQSISSAQGDLEHGGADTAGGYDVPAKPMCRALILPLMWIRNR